MFGEDLRADARRDLVDGHDHPEFGLDPASDVQRDRGRDVLRRHHLRSDLFATDRAKRQDGEGESECDGATEGKQHGRFLELGTGTG